MIQDKPRYSNIELLRLVLMLMIVMFHYVCHGLHFNTTSAYTTPFHPWWGWFLYPIVCYKVNCFVFISGYFGIKFSTKKILSFIIQLFFYALCTFIIFTLLNGNSLSVFFNVSTWCKLFNINGRWWFAYSYLFLMLLAPILNYGLNGLSKRQLEITILSLIIFSTSGFRWWAHATTEPTTIMVTTYTIAGYIRRYPCDFLIQHCRLIWFTTITILLFWSGIYYFTGSMSADKWIYISANNNPLCLLASISFFYVFQQIKIPNIKIINFLASGVFAVYLCTDGFLREIYNSWAISTTKANIWYLLALAFVTVFSISTFDAALKWSGNKLLCKIIA